MSRLGDNQIDTYMILYYMIVWSLINASNLCVLAEIKLIFVCKIQMQRELVTETDILYNEPYNVDAQVQQKYLEKCTEV